MARIDHDGSGVLRRNFENALARHGKPDIINTDQGSQFTGAVFTGLLVDNSTTALRSAWTAKAPGGTTSSSSGYDAANAERFAKFCAFSTRRQIRWIEESQYLAHSGPQDEEDEKKFMPEKEPATQVAKNISSSF